MTLRFLTAGESHGPEEVAILEGMPADVEITVEEVNAELKKRMHDIGRGGRGKIESDEAKIVAGVRFGKTLGSPIALLVSNLDFKNWTDRMSVGPNSREADVSIKVTHPRPGHADLTGVLKYGFDDARNILERASARETTTRVAIGAVCKKFLSYFGIEIASHTIQIGPIKAPQKLYEFSDIKNIGTTDPDVHCIDETAREAMKKIVLDARLNKDTLGGVVEIVATGVPIGLGSHVHFDRKIDGRIAQALMSIPSVKAVELGNAISASEKTGKEVQDAIYLEADKLVRKTNNMGGIEGGMTNGENIICRVYHKPLSTIFDPLPTIDLKTHQKTVAAIERSDVCIVARGGVVSESMLAFVLAQAMLEKFGGDNIAETKRNYDNYNKNLPIHK